MEMVATTRRRRAARSAATVAAVAAVTLVLSLTSLSARAAAASGQPRAKALSAKQVRGAAATKKAVIVVGPVEGTTPTYLTKGEAIADAAEAQGMEVVRIFHPNATWGRVVAEANGADLFVYLGHGNGWPSPYGSFQEDTKNGLGLNSQLNGSAYTTKYYGGNKIREQIRFADNAIVILNKLCYAEGNGEPGMAIPTQDVARQRVDNFAAAFLATGARAVFALGWQPGENIVNSLFDSTPRTMDDVFKRRFGSNSDGSYKPWFGWIGWKPNLYFDSVRTPGAQNHLDPDAAEGYLRGLSGDLDMTTDEWLGLVDPNDTDPPVVTNLSGNQAADTIPAGKSGVPVFTPNGDGISDTMTLRHTVSEGAFLRIDIRRETDGAVVRTFNAWSPQGPGTTKWDGRNDSNKFVKDGRYDVEVTPRDRAGNVGVMKTTPVKVLTAMKAPGASPVLFHSADGDTLAQTSSQALTLTKAATLTWRILDAQGDVVRRGLVDQSFPAGAAGWTWDGRNDAGAQVPNGLYTSMVSATTDNGTYSHKLGVRVGPFNLKAKLKVNPGQTQTVTIMAAEPVSGWPRIEVKQPGKAMYTLYPVKYSPTKFTARWTVKSGGTGTIKITISSTDTRGGTQSQTFNATLQ